MNWFSAVIRRKTHEQKLDAELRFHLERQIAENIAAGMSSDEARRQAALEFGGLEQIKDECRDVWSGRWLEGTLQDLRFGLRSLRRAPGFTIAALATIGLGVVLGPEAPLIALGSGLGVLTIRLARRDAPPQVATVLASAGSFAAASFLFQSPLIAAVIMLEVVGLGGPKLTLVLLPGLLASGIGDLVSVGMGSWTGLSTSAYALGPVEGLAKFVRPDIADFGWTIALALAVALACVLMVSIGRRIVGIVAVRRFMLLPAAGLIVAGLAIAFQQATGKPFQEVLFSGQAAIPGLVTKAGTWSIGALALLVVFKGIAYSLSLGSFRGGPTFPALFLGATAGLMAGQLPGYSITPAIAVGMAAAVAVVLRLPLSAIVIAALLTAGSGAGSEPLVIVGTIVAYMVGRTLLAPPAAAAPAAARP